MENSGSRSEEKRYAVHAVDAKGAFFFLFGEKGAGKGMLLREKKYIKGGVLSTFFC